MKVRIDFPAEHGARLVLELKKPSAMLIATSLDEVEAVVAQAERLSKTGLWVAGFVSYEAAPAFDAALQVRDSSGSLPLAVFAAYASAGEPEMPEDAAWLGSAWQMDSDYPEVERGIEAIRAAIADGEYYQINYTGRLRSTFQEADESSGAAFFEALRQTQPNGYCAHFASDDWQVLSVSPELFFDWRADQAVPMLTTQPMKGTAPRYSSTQADEAARAGLYDSKKDRAENVMIVDLLRNDMARVGVTGTVSVPQLFEIQGLPTAWQMTSTVQCETRPDVGLVEVFRALFPCGSITGAPKIAAMRAIAELETSSRGAYCGAIGVIRPGGHATFNVGIRTVTLDSVGKTAECGLGSGITWESLASDEYAEWLVKRRFLLRASAGFELFETLRLEDNAFFLLEQHLARMQDSAEHFGFSFDLANAGSQLMAVRQSHEAGAWRVRLLLNCHGAFRTESTPIEIKSVVSDAALDVVLAKTPVNSADERLRHKTTQREVYDCHELPPGAYDTLLWNERGELTEFTRGNVIVELDGRRLTPPLHCGLLAGTLRTEMLAKGEIEEAILRVSDLNSATKIWFINSVRGMLAVQVKPSEKQ